MKKKTSSKTYKRLKYFYRVERRMTINRTDKLKNNLIRETFGFLNLNTVTVVL